MPAGGLVRFFQKQSLRQGFRLHNLGKDALPAETIAEQEQGERERARAAHQGHVSVLAAARSQGALACRSRLCICAAPGEERHPCSSRWAGLPQDADVGSRALGLRSQGSAAPRPRGHSLKQVSEAGLSQQPSPEQRGDQHEVSVRRFAGSGEAPALHRQEEAPQVFCSSHPLSLYTPLTLKPQKLLRDPQPATTPGIHLPSEPQWHWP